MFDLFDPDRTSTGQQWYLRDQVSLLYNAYRGLRCHFRFRLQTYAGAATDAIIVCVRPGLSASTSAYTDMQLAISQPYGVSHIIVNGQREYVIEGTYEPWQLLGITKAQYLLDNSYIAAVSGPPAFASVLNLVYQSANAGSQPYVVGTLEMETEFQYLNPVVQSMS